MVATTASRSLLEPRRWHHIIPRSRAGCLPQRQRPHPHPQPRTGCCTLDAAHWTLPLDVASAGPALPCPFPLAGSPLAGAGTGPLRVLLPLLPLLAPSRLRAVTTACIGELPLTAATATLLLLSGAVASVLVLLCRAATTTRPPLPLYHSTPLPLAHHARSTPRLLAPELLTLPPERTRSRATSH